MSDKKRTFTDILLLAGMALAIPCLLFTVLNNCLTNWPLYEHSRPLFCILTVLASAGLFLLSRHLRTCKLHLTQPVLAGIALAVFCIQLVCALLLRHTPFTDTEQIVTAAINLANTGAFETSARSYQYFSWYPFNLGTVYLYAFLFRFMAVFGITDHYLIISVFAGFLFAAGFLCGVKTAESYSRPAALLFLVFSAVCFPFYYCTAELYTDVLALPFPMIVLYLYRKLLSTDRLRTQILLILLFALAALAGFLIRVTTLIIPIACLITLLLHKQFRLFAVCLAASLVLLLSGNTAIEAKNARHLGAEQLRIHRLSVWHYLAMGLPAHEDEGYGQYGDGGWLILSTSFDDPDARDARLREEVRNRVYYLRYPNRLLNMLSRKNVSTFGDGTFHLNQLIEADEHEITNGLKNIVYSSGSGFPLYFHLCTALFYAQMLLAAFNCLQSLRRAKTDAAPVYLTLIGAFLYLTLWETNARYFFMFEFLLILACSLSPASESAEA